MGFSFSFLVVVELSSPSLHFVVLQGTVRVSKHCNEAVVMTDGSSSKDSGDDAQQTHNRRTTDIELKVKFKRFLAYCVNSASYNRWFATQSCIICIHL